MSGNWPHTRREPARREHPGTWPGHNRRTGQPPTASWPACYTTSSAVSVGRHSRRTQAAAARPVSYSAHAHAGAEILTMAAPVGAGGTPPAARGPWRRGRHRARKYPPLWHVLVRKRGPSGATQIGDSVPSRISRGARALALAGRDCEAFGQPRRVSGCDMLGLARSVPGDANRCPAGPGLTAQAAARRDPEAGGGVLRLLPRWPVISPESCLVMGCRR